MARAYALDEKGNQVTVAESDKTIRIEGNHYFPPNSVNDELLVDSETHTVCHWKGEASYKTVKVGDKEYLDGAWYYPRPDSSAIDRVGQDFSNYYAFWHGVELED